MMSRDNAAIGKAWLDAFNEQDLEKLLALYDDEARHYSPKLKIRQPETQGLIIGKPALRTWWKDAFERMPDLRYKATSITANDERVFLEYERIVPGEDVLLVAEAYDIVDGKIVYSRVYHG